MDSKLLKGLGAFAGAAVVAGGIVLGLGLGGDAEAADPMKSIPLTTKQALTVEPISRAAAVADVAACAQAEQDARAAYEAVDAALSDPAAPAVGTAAHDALLAARFAAKAEWAAAGAAANAAQGALQVAQEAQKSAETDFDRALCGATKTQTAKVADYCARFAEPVAAVPPGGTPGLEAKGP
jgi:hypothetical protein